MVSLIVLTYRRIWSYIISAIRLGYTPRNRPDLAALQQELALYEYRIATKFEVLDLIKREFENYSGPRSHAEIEFLAKARLHNIITHSQFEKYSLRNEQRKTYNLWDTDSREL